MPRQKASIGNNEPNNEIVFSKKSRVVEFLKDIFRESSLDGVKYITLEGLHTVERVFWTAIVLASIGFSVYLFLHLYSKYQANPVFISFESKATPIMAIPFPAITICNVNTFKAPNINEVIRILMDEERIPGFNLRPRFLKYAAIAEYLAHYCLAAPSYRRLLHEKLFAADGTEDFIEGLQRNLEHVKVNVSLDNDYMLGEVFRREVENFRDKASHSCEDMILKCLWESQIESCHKFFFPIHTQYGSCCVFNMVPVYILQNIPENDSRIEDEKRFMSPEAISAWEHFSEADLISDNLNSDETFTYPFRQKQGGKPYGLSLIINPELDLYSTCTSNDAYGFKVLAHSPVSFPNTMNYGKAIPPDREIFLEIEPELITAHEDSVKSIDVAKRNCYFPSDLQANLDSYEFYTSGNCMDECSAKYTYMNCSCVREYMPRNSTQKLCGARNLRCAEQVRENLTNSGRVNFCLKCKPACTEIKYKMRATDFPIGKATDKSDFNNDGNIKISASNYSILHIYLGTDRLFAKERRRLYDIADLISNAGGEFGLTLGFSIISLLEIVYFFTFKLLFFLLSFRRPH